jgi:hypothetical protein
LLRSEPGYQFVVEAVWAEAHPQSMHLLREEQKAWARITWPFVIVVS